MAASQKHPIYTYKTFDRPLLIYYLPIITNLPKSSILSYEREIFRKFLYFHYLHPSINLHNFANMKTITAHFFFLFHRFTDKLYNRPQHFKDILMKKRWTTHYPKKKRKSSTNLHIKSKAADQ